MKILNTIVFYDNKDEVQSYIEEVASIGRDTVDIVLVVNSDKNNEVNGMIKELRTKGINCFQVMDHADNIGYLNTMLKTVKKIDIDQYDYLILSNTDIHYDTEEFFFKLAEKKYPKEIGCIAPCVFATQSNSYSNPHYLERIPRGKLERNSKIFRYPLLGKLYLMLSGLKTRRTKTEKKISCYVYSPHGCYMIFTRTFIQKILGYEYGVKMYSEESAVGELLHRNGMKCFYDDSISVIHKESSVTGKIDYRKRFRLWRESLIYILDEFY